MKSKVIFLTIFGALIFKLSMSQLAITGSNASFKRANIETDLLMELIQQKQQEVKQRVFRNLVVNNFNNFLGDETALNNFTTYYYTYTIFDILTSGKSKRLLSKELLQSATELGYIYSLAWYSYLKHYQEYDVKINKGVCRLIKLPDVDVKSSDSVQLKARSVKQKMYENIFQESEPLRVKQTERVKAEVGDTIRKKRFLINLFLDVSFDVLLSESTQERFKFRYNLSDPEFKLWFDEDNFYQKRFSNEKPSSDTIACKELRNAILSDLNQLNAVDPGSDNQIKKLNEVLHSFIKIKCGELGLDTINKAEVSNLLLQLYHFVKLTNQRYENDVVSVLFDLILNNITVDQDENKKDIVYVEAEAIISSLYDEYTKVAERKGWNKYVAPVLNIGANYSHFINGNNLSRNDDGTTSSLKNLVFASEKIGIKYKIYNWNYTRSQPVGKSIRYYGGAFSWLRPQNKPIVSDFFVSAYVSGLLYNVVNVKTNKSFDYGIFGGSLGLTFFNSLEVSAEVGVPFYFSKPKSGEPAFNPNNTFIGLAFDLPLVEYINALANKKKKE